MSKKTTDAQASDPSTGTVRVRSHLGVVLDVSSDKAEKMVAKGRYAYVDPPKPAPEQVPAEDPVEAS